LKGKEMRRIKPALILGVVFILLLGPGSMETQVTYAIDCELQRFSDFLDANDQYSTTFYSWYFDEPVRCQDECLWAAFPLICEEECRNSRYNSFVGAQEALIQVAGRSCTYDPNRFGEVQAQYNQCLSTLNGHWASPVYDENGNIDGTWFSFINQEFMACRLASGIDNYQ
jgi:hypothetical protein